MNFIPKRQEETETKRTVETLTKEKTETITLPLTKTEILVKTAIEYETLNQREKLLAARRNVVLRPIIETAIDLNGIEDANGSKIWNELDCTMTRQRSARVSFNEVVAEEILKKKKQ